MIANENFCPIRDILDRIGDKWSILMLMTLHEKGVLRFGELARNIPTFRKNADSNASYLGGRRLDNAYSLS